MLEILLWMVTFGQKESVLGCSEGNVLSLMIMTLKMATDTDTGTNVSHLLSVVSYNCSGYNKSSTYLKELVNCSKCDILCLQETWLLDGNMHKLADVNLDYSFTGVSGVDSGDCVLQVVHMVELLSFGITHWVDPLQS